MYKMTDTDVCPLHFTSVSLYNLKSALTTSQIWQYKFNSWRFDFCYSFCDTPVAKLTCALVNADAREQVVGGGWVIESVLLVDAWPMNNASQCDLACGKKTFMHVYASLLKHLDNIFIKYLNGILYCILYIYSKFVYWLESANEMGRFYVCDDVTS